MKVLLAGYNVDRDVLDELKRQTPSNTRFDRCPPAFARPSGFVSGETLCYKKEAMNQADLIPDEAGVPRP